MAQRVKAGTAETGFAGKQADFRRQGIWLQIITVRGGEDQIQIVSVIRSKLAAVFGLITAIFA
jgi:hypothetical protein